MKRIGICLFAALIAMFMVLPAASAQDKKPTAVKIGVIDMKRIIKESKAAKSAMEIFKKDLEAKKGVLAAKQKEIQAMEAELKAADPKLADDDRRQKTDKLAREARELKLTAADMETELKRKDAELTQKLFAEVTKVVNAYTKKENITLVIERSAVIAMDGALDITGAIIQAYDAGK